MLKLAPVITIDGPSGVGKSTLCQEIAKQLRWSFLKSGLIYRFIAFLILKQNILIKEKNIIPLAKYLNIDWIKQISFQNLKNNHKFYHTINSQKLSDTASRISTYPYIRTILLKKQQEFRCFPGLVAEGRDMGTIVFPDAIIKFFLDANLECRVQRRMLELKKNSCNIDHKKLLIEMKNRDQRDQKRLISPLCPSKNAIILNSSEMSFSEVVNISMMYILKKIKI